MHLGKFDANLKFIPNDKFKLLDLEEQNKYIFSEDWDVSEIRPVSDSTNEQSLANACEFFDEFSRTWRQFSKFFDQSDEDVSERSKVYTYGAFWLLEQIVKKIGLYDDLLSTFDDNNLIVDQILSICLFPYITDRFFYRLSSFRLCNNKYYKTSINCDFKAIDIVNLVNKIREKHGIYLANRRMRRHLEEYSKSNNSINSLEPIKYIAFLNLNDITTYENFYNIISVHVYSSSSGEPVYYKNFPRNSKDNITMQIILDDLIKFGIKSSEITFIRDYAFVGEELLAIFVSKNLSFMLYTGYTIDEIFKLLLNVKYRRDGTPIGMELGKKIRYYFKVMEVPPFIIEFLDDSNIKVEGLKANFYLDLDSRENELDDLEYDIEYERNLLNKDLENNNIPSDIDEYNTNFNYFDVKELKDKSGKISGYTFKKTSRIELDKARCGFSYILTNKVDISGIDLLWQNIKLSQKQYVFTYFQNALKECIRSDCRRDIYNFLGFVALIPVSYLENIRKKFFAEEYGSLEEILGVMLSIKLAINDAGQEEISIFTDEQLEIARACGIEPPKQTFEYFD